MACAGPSTVQDFKDDDDFVTINGVLSSQPELDRDKLILYVLPTIDGAFKGEVVVCVAFNDENKNLLKKLNDKLVGNEKELVIFGSNIEGSWQEYMDGIDVNVYAISFYNLNAQKYQTIITGYGGRFRDVVKSMSWNQFLIEVGKKAAKAAL